MTSIAGRSGARTNATADRDRLPIPGVVPAREDRGMVTFARRLVPLLLAGMLLVPLAGTAAAEEPGPTVDDATLVKFGSDLVKLTNSKRSSVGLVALRTDATLMQVARDRAKVMATNDVLSHTEPDGTKAWDRLNAAGLTWYGAGEIIAWNHYPVEYTAAEAIRAWWASPGHHAIMVSTGYNYVGFGAAMSADGKFYFAGVFAKLRDHTAPWAGFRKAYKHTVSATHKRVTVRWKGNDTRLQVLTAGLRYFEVKWRRVGGDWHSWGTTTATSHRVRWHRGVTYEVWVRSRDKVGLWGAWHIKRITP
jgi:uncharacterized protein YkwD